MITKPSGEELEIITKEEVLRGMIEGHDNFGGRGCSVVNNFSLTKPFVIYTQIFSNEAS